MTATLRDDTTDYSLDYLYDELDADGWPPVRVQSLNSPDLHFHEETESRDCDGGHGNERIHYGWGDDTGRLAWNAYCAMMVDHFGRRDNEAQRMKRTTDANGMARLEFGGPTEEGYHWTTAYTCTDQCRGRRTYVYDQYAQAAGY
jgi:hypothetical protein